MAIETKEQAAFNLALPYLQRINGILNSNYHEFKNANERTFAINLKQLYRELRPWLVVDVNREVDEVEPFTTAFKELAKMRKSDKEKVWEKMEEIEMMMRAHFKSLGMLMPKINDPRYLFGNNKQR